MFRKYCAAILYMALVAAAVSSCKKQLDSNTIVNSPIINTGLSNEASGGGREDDDKPIVQHRSVSSTSKPITGADVTLIAGTDTLYAVSDSRGNSVFRIPALGSCRVIVNHSGYQSSDSLFIITNSITAKTSVLQNQ